MHKLALSFKGKVIHEFSSYCQFFIYLSDLITKVAIVFLFSFITLLHKFLSVTDHDLAMYVGMYIASVIIWGMLLLKLNISRKEIFGKSKFDIYFMGLLTIALVSVLLSDDRVKGVFGSTGTWSFSIITYLSVAVIYYITSILFRYSRGIKWLAIAFLGSILVPSIYHMNIVLQDKSANNLDYFRYAVMTIPLTIGVIFTFKKLVLRVISFITLLLNLFLVAYYSRFLSGSMFILNVGVLSLFILFYFSFWVKNSRMLVDFLKGILSNFQNIKTLKKELSKKKKELVVFAMMLFMALWILGFAIYAVNYFNNNIGSFLFSWMREDIDKIDGIGMWIIGKNDLSKVFSSFEMINVLANYGIFGFVIWVLLMASAIYISSKLTLKLLYIGNFRNIILLSSIYVTFFMIFLNFLLSRFSPLTFIMLIYTSSVLAIISDLIDRKEMYKLPDCRKTVAISDKIFRIILSILVIAFIGLGIVGILTGLDKGIF